MPLDDAPRHGHTAYRDMGIGVADEAVTRHLFSFLHADMREELISVKAVGQSLCALCGSPL